MLAISLHHLRCYSLNHTASPSCADSPLNYALYGVLVHQLIVLLAASSRPILTDKPLPFASKLVFNNHYDIKQ